MADSFTAKMQRVSRSLTNSSTTPLHTLENAIYVSYLENVFLGRDDERCRSARSGLSGRLAAALVSLEEHWKNIAEWNRKRYSR